MPDTNEKMKFRYNNKEQRNIKMNTFLTMGFAVLYLEMAAYLILQMTQGNAAVFSAAYTSPLFVMQSDTAIIHATILFIFIANSPSTHSLLFTMISQKGKLIIFIPIIP